MSEKEVVKAIKEMSKVMDKELKEVTKILKSIEKGKPKPVMCTYLVQLRCRHPPPETEKCKKCGIYRRWLKQNKKIISPDFRMV